MGVYRWVSHSMSPGTPGGGIGGRVARRRELRLVGGLVRQAGPSSAVLQWGELPAAAPGPGEVRARLIVSGVNPGDTKKRRGWLGSAMPFPRVIPHSDGEGVVDAVGEGVDSHRPGRRVWVFGAQSYRPFGTAAQLTVVPAWQAVELPDGVSVELGACLAIPGITAHRAVFGDGPVAGTTILVHGVLGGVGALASQLANWAGATVIGTVRRSGDGQLVDESAVAHVAALDQPDAGSRHSRSGTRRRGPDHRGRLLSENIDLDAAVVKNGAVIAAYATRQDRSDFPVQRRHRSTAVAATRHAG